MVFAKIIIGDSRKMSDIQDESIDLIVTSPPYWHIKDYGVEGQIGYGQTLHEYLKSLYIVWKESFRVLKPGGRLCINIGDQFLRRVIYGKYKIAPIHSEFIIQCEKIGFDYMGSIIWQKKTTMHTTGGATVMGSYPYPPNGMIEIDYEYILIFKKPGKRKPPSKEIKEKSKLTKEEWKEYFSGHWRFPGEKQIDHEAMFPEELPKRLIKMFTFVGDIVLDPFLGSGTTIKAAISLGRNSIGYEINEKYIPVIKKKIGYNNSLLHLTNKVNIEIIEKKEPIEKKYERVDYTPSIKDIKPIISPQQINSDRESLYKVKEIISPNKIKIEGGTVIKLLGINIKKEKITEAKEYLNNYVKNKYVFIRLDPKFKSKNKEISAYVFLKNRIFVNKEMIKKGFAEVEDIPFKYKDVFKNIFTQINGEVA